MRNSLNYSRAGLFAALILSLAALACSSTKGPEEVTPLNPAVGDLAGAPDWILRGCSAFWGDDTPSMLCGVGSVSGTRNHSLAVSGARARGRTEIARVLDTKVRAMLKDYQATTTGGEEFGTAANDEQHLVDVSKQLTDIELTGVEQRDMWISPSGVVYVLMVYDAEKFKDTVSQMSQLSESVRKAVVERAEASFQELDEAIEEDRNR
jgi:hypothetical protein